MDQNTKRTGLLNWVVLLGAALGMLLISSYVSSAAAVMGAILTGFGLLVALMSYFQIGLLEREQFEKLELEELSKSRGSESLFATAGADTFPAKRSREQFERYFVPAFTGLLFLLQAAAAYWPWKKLALHAAGHRGPGDAGDVLAGNDGVDSVPAGQILQRPGPAERAEDCCVRARPTCILSAYACLAVNRRRSRRFWRAFPE